MDNKDQFPSFFEQIKNLSNLAKEVVTDFANGEEVLVSEDEQNRRMEICNNCDYYFGERCKVCGCFMQTKTKFTASQCPAMKW